MQWLLRFPLHRQARTIFRGPYNKGYRILGSILGGSGDLVSRLITSITHIVTLNIPIINLFTKSP